MQKIVFNAHYLMYFDTAIADYWRALALPYEATMQHFDGDLYVRKATVEFHASARIEDQLDIGLRCGRIGNSSMLFEGAIFRAGDLLIGSELVYVFADPATQTSRPVPLLLREILTGYEAGEDMLTVRVGDWDTLGADAQRVRTEVFVQEQRIPAEIEWDDADGNALHAVAYNRLGQPLATGRLIAQAPGIGRIGRMAVERTLRGTGFGDRVLDALEQAAHQRGERELLLHAQCSAQGFYARSGYRTQGKPFDEAGIAHIEMHKAL